MAEDRIFRELQEIKELALLSAKDALTMRDAATLSGLSMSHLYKLVSQKQIPHYKGAGGKLTYFDKTEFNSWLLAHRVPTNDELEAEAVKRSVMKGGPR